MSLKFAVIVLGSGVAAYCFYRQRKAIEARVQLEVEEALWQESIARAQVVLAKHEKSLEDRADALREELENLEFEANELWWLGMEPTLADIRDLPEIEPVREVEW